MTPELICRQLTGAGIHMRAEDGKLMVSPISLLTPDERQLLQDHKPELLDFLQRRTLEELLGAAERVCDLYGDGAEARVDMRVDVLATPLHLRTDLLDHFLSITSATAENLATSDLEDFDVTPIGLKEIA